MPFFCGTYFVLLTIFVSVPHLSLPNPSSTAVGWMVASRFFPLLSSRLVQPSSYSGIFNFFSWARKGKCLVGWKQALLFLMVTYDDHTGRPKAREYEPQALMDDTKPGTGGAGSFLVFI